MGNNRKKKDVDAVLSFLYLFLGFSYLCLFIWGIFLARKSGLLQLTHLLLLVIIGLIYDNLIIAIGKFIGEGNVLERLSYVRFLLHALFTPTLILFAFGICKRLGLPWSKKTIWKIVFSLTTLGLILYELLASVSGLELEPNWEDGILTYTSNGHSDSPIMVIIVTVILGIIGFILTRKFHFPWLLLGTIIMISGGILTIWIKNSSIMNLLELLLMIALLITWQFQVKYQKRQN